jgi:hypothetical protein
MSMLTTRRRTYLCWISINKQVQNNGHWTLALNEIKAMKQIYGPSDMALVLNYNGERKEYKQNNS